MSQYSQWYANTLRAEGNAILALEQSLDHEVMDQIVALLLTMKEKKRRVIFTGCGTSGTAAQRISHILSCIEVPSVFLSPADAPHGALGFVQKGDVVVMLAKGGNTAELISLIPSVLQKGATLIGVTNAKDSVLAKKADICLLLSTGEEPDEWHLLPCASTLCAIAAFDAIIHTVMRENGFTKEEFLRIHPGGATGEILSKNLGRG